MFLNEHYKGCCAYRFVHIFPSAGIFVSGELLGICIIWRKCELVPLLFIITLASSQLHKCVFLCLLQTSNGSCLINNHHHKQLVTCSLQLIFLREKALLTIHLSLIQMRQQCLIHIKIPDLRMQIKIPPLVFYVHPVPKSDVKSHVKRYTSSILNARPSSYITSET